MDSTSGRGRATDVSIIRLLRATSLLTWLAPRTLTNTAPGAMFRNTGTSGRRVMLKRGGLRIATATGFGLIRGDGPGLKTSPGVMLRSTMAAGCTTTTTGGGRRDRFMFARTIRRHWSHGLVARAGARASDLA